MNEIEVEVPAVGIHQVGKSIVSVTGNADQLAAKHIIGVGRNTYVLNQLLADKRLVRLSNVQRYF